MKVLLVDAFGPNKEGRSRFNALKRSLGFVIEKETPTASIITRKCTEIGNYVYDWEKESIISVAGKLNCLRFDELNLICIGGDMVEICPWDPLFQDTIVLLHMALMVDKPVLGIGIGAFAAVYSRAARGVRFSIVNGPLGDPVEKLESYPRYYQYQCSGQQLPSSPSSSGFLANDTGDIYEYLPKTKQWRPVCNIGTLRKHVDHDSSLEISHHPEKTTVTVRSDQMPRLVDDEMIENPYLKGVKSQSFDLGPSPNWQLTRTDEGIFADIEMVIMAVDKEGHPVLLSHEKSGSLFTSCALDEGGGFSSTSLIIGNFCKYTQQKERRSLKKKITDFVASFDRERFIRRELYLAAAVLPVTSSLPSGAMPVKLKSKPQSVVSNDDESEIYQQDLLDFINESESDAPTMAPLTRAPRLVVTPPDSIDTVGYLEKLQRSTSEPSYLLRKQYDLGWKYPLLKMGEFRPPEIHQQEVLTSWQQLSFDREAAERAAKGLPPPASPSHKSSQSQADSLSILETESEMAHRKNALLDKHQFLEKRMKRLEKGVELSDMTPPTEEMHVHSRHLRTAGKASVQNTSRSPNPSPSKTRGNAIVHSVSTGFKFDINVVSSQSRIKADVQSRKGKPSPPSAFLAPTAQKMKLSVNRNLHNPLPTMMRGEGSPRSIDVELSAHLASVTSQSMNFDVDDVSLQSRTSR